MSTPAAESQGHSISPQQTYVPPENQEKYQPGMRADELQRQQTQLVSSVRPGPGIKANPGPLGLFGFATTTFVLGLYQCGAGLPHSNPESGVGPFQAVFGLAIFYGGAAQFIAGCFEFACCNTFGFTVHCTYGAFWLSFAMFMIPSLGIEAAYKGDMRAYSFAIGIYLILWCFVTLIFLIGALRTNVAIVATFFFLTLAFFFLSLAQFLLTENSKQSVRLNKTGGAFAIICAATAFWAGIYGLYSKDKTFVTVKVYGLYKHQRHDVEDGHGVGQVNGEGERAKLAPWKRVTRMGRH